NPKCKTNRFNHVNRELVLGPRLTRRGHSAAETIIVLQYLYIRPVMGYADVIWSSCDKEALYRFLKLQKPTAGIILYTDHLAPSNMMEPIQKKKKTTVAALNTRALLLMMSSTDSLLVESLAAFVKVKGNPKCSSHELVSPFHTTPKTNKFTHVNRELVLGLRLMPLTIDSSLSFDCHVENLCNKLALCIRVLS
ncbi:hypothetical protein pdam_00024258, partial [Pocillopora damicornis]